jgi:hypothetical protein
VRGPCTHETLDLPAPPRASDELIAEPVGAPELEAQTTRSGYSKALEYEYRLKTVVLGTLKRYSILSLTLYLEWYSAYSILYSDGPH